MGCTGIRRLVGLWYTRREAPFEAHPRLEGRNDSTENQREVAFDPLIMARDIQPLTPDDLPALSRFLAAGFHAPPGADFAAPEVLRWKYLESMRTMPDCPRAGDFQSEPGSSPEGSAAIDLGSDLPRSYIARDRDGRIVGHLGLCRTIFEGQTISAADGRVEAMHIIDWLGSPNHRSIGLSLLRQVHRGLATQFALGATPVAQAVGERAGYEVRGLVPVYNRVLRVGYWLRTVSQSPLERELGLARELAIRLRRISARPGAVLALARVPAFGPEISPIMAKAKAHAILTDRHPARLNAFLRFPRQAFSGWHLRDQAGGLRGFAVLNLVPHDEGKTRTGKIVDCLVDNVEVPLWQAAILALTRELTNQGADVAQVYASTPWMSEALGQCGFISRFGVKFLLRDPAKRLPRGATFHLTTLEGDYSYT
jgi:hypothetical protein